MSAKPIKKEEEESRIRKICLRIDALWLDTLQELRWQETTNRNELKLIQAWLNKIREGAEKIDLNSKISKEKVIEHTEKLIQITAAMIEDGGNRLKQVNNQMEGLLFEYVDTGYAKEIEKDEKLYADKIKRVEKEALKGWSEVKPQMKKVLVTLLTETKDHPNFYEGHINGLNKFLSAIHGYHPKADVIDLTFERLETYLPNVKEKRIITTLMVGKDDNPYVAISLRLNTLPNKIEELCNVLSGAIKKYKSYHKEIGDVYYSGWVSA